MTLLLVDDEPHIRQMMRLTLEAAGYEIDEAADGQAGLDRFGDGRRYDAVVLDQKMPGLDGLDTLRQIKQRAPDACVLMVTAFASIDLAVDAMRLGATDFLRKPMTPETLRGAVAAAIAGHAGPHVAAQTRTPRSAQPSDIAVLTMNGFRITRVSPAATPSSPEHAFRVTHGGDEGASTVSVAIDGDVVARVARLTRRQLEPGGAFWRLQAERLLSDYLWNEGRLPPDNRLVVRDVSREDLDAAARWESD